MDKFATKVSFVIIYYFSVLCKYITIEVSSRSCVFGNLTMAKTHFIVTEGVDLCTKRNIHRYTRGTVKCIYMAQSSSTSLRPKNVLHYDYRKTSLGQTFSLSPLIC
jgi:hypothetical protein